ncbi:MAG TPA: peptidylprolyl isomerase [Gemmatimonadaceae bacterium]|nr:peptidylprolyl isomerase [Gemmatimonadaceae bacterium]
MQLRKTAGIIGFLFVAAGTAGAQLLPPAITEREVTLFARLLAMTDTRTLDMALVERTLANRWRPLRAAGTLAIGQVGSERGMAGAARLRGLLRDRDPNVAGNAAYALGLLRDTSAVNALFAALQGDHSVTREAAWALGEIGGPARGAISAALSRGERDHDTAIQLLLAAAKLRPVPLAELRPYLNSGHPSVIWAASYAIARTRAAAGVRDLIALERSPRLRDRPQNLDRTAAMSAPYTDGLSGNQRARAEIARGLAKSAAGDSLGREAQAVLGRLIADVEPQVRINALRSMATYGSPARAALLYGARDFSANVRVATAQSLGTVIGRDGADWATYWAADTSLVYRAGLLASAARAGYRPPELQTWAGHADWRYRAAVANAAGDSLDRRFAISRVANLLRDPDPRVRQAAYGALLPPASVPLEDSVHDWMVAGLRDPDFYVRATVIGALAERPTSADLPAVLASYNSAARDSSNDARLSAIQYVAALWKKDSLRLSQSARDQITAVRAPADPLERAAGKTVPMWRSWAGVAARARPLSYYDNIVRGIVMPAYVGKSLNATIHTSRGAMRLEMFGTDAPITVYNFLTLARTGYYRNTRFHRVVPNFVAQDGDPRDDGNGGPGYSIRDEMNRHRYERGAVGMALSGPDTGGSQYFITHSPQPHLDGHYTVFARVIRGYDVLDRIVQGDRITRIDPR